jgi:creatinine amidohydrolase
MHLADLPWTAIQSLSKDTPVVIPVAAVEQHGHHLPVYTDSILLGEVVRRASLQTGGKILYAPLQWLGNSHHHIDFPGTVSAGPRLYLDLLVELMETFIGYGFRKVVFLNGHGGNITPGKQAVFEVRQRMRQRDDLLLLFATYWEFAKPRETRSDLVQTQMGHACEWETSMILRINSKLVGDYQNAPEVPFGFGFEPAYRGWTTRDRTERGHIGVPAQASAEKGEHLLNEFSNGVVKFLNEVATWNRGSWE